MIEYVLVFFAVIICALIYLARVGKGPGVPTSTSTSASKSKRHITFSDTCAERAYSKKTGRVGSVRTVPMNDLVHALPL